MATGSALGNPHFPSTRGARRTAAPRCLTLVQRDFHADVENALWFTDLTMIRTGQGWLYAAVILDAFSREVISYTTNDRGTTETAWCALAEAIRTRRPPKECIIHSDHGYQFTAHQWLALAEGAGMRVSFGANKSPLDNAAMESWFSSYKSEGIFTQRHPTNPRRSPPTTLQLCVAVQHATATLHPG